MIFKRRAAMSSAERRLDLYKLVALAVAAPPVVIGSTSDVDVLVTLAVLVIAVVQIGTEVIRARRHGHPTLNGWIPQRTQRPGSRSPRERR